MGIVSVLNFSTPRYKVCVWRAVPYEPTGFTDIQMLAMRLQDTHALQELAEELCRQPGVLQVEVLDWDNNGVHCFNE
jgi:hypothetical protein